MRKLTESFLKGEAQDDPTIGEEQKAEFREFMEQLTDTLLGRPEQD